MTTPNKESASGKPEKWEVRHIPETISTMECWELHIGDQCVAGFPTWTEPNSIVAAHNASLTALESVQGEKPEWSASYREGWLIIYSGEQEILTIKHPIEEVEAVVDDLILAHNSSPSAETPDAARPKDATGQMELNEPPEDFGIEPPSPSDYVRALHDEMRGSEPRELVLMPSGLEFHNACHGPCDMLVGPCVCGAWHRLRDLPYRIFKQLRAVDRKAPQDAREASEAVERGTPASASLMSQTESKEEDHGK